MVLISIVTGGYKPTYNWGASHCSLSNSEYMWLNADKWQVIDQSSAMGINFVSPIGAQAIVLCHSLLEKIPQGLPPPSPGHLLLKLDCWFDVCHQRDRWRDLFLRGHPLGFLGMIHGWLTLGRNQFWENLNQIQTLKVISTWGKVLKLWRKWSLGFSK